MGGAGSGPGGGGVGPPGGAGPWRTERRVPTPSAPLGGGRAGPRAPLPALPRTLQMSGSSLSLSESLRALAPLWGNPGAAGRGPSVRRGFFLGRPAGDSPSSQLSVDAPELSDSRRRRLAGAGA